MLNELAEYEKNVNRSLPKFKIYKKASQAIASYPTKLQSGREAKKLEGIGDKTAEKIDEFITSGKLDKLEKIRADDTHVAMSFLTRVTGIGPVAAQKLAQEGITTLEDLRANSHKLNHHQQIGVRYFSEFDKRIPRSEVESILEVLGEGIKEEDPKLDFKACGSFRRGAATCGDVDILLTHPDHKSDTPNLKEESRSLLKRVVERLETGILTDTISQGDTKYMGVCCLPPSESIPSPLHRRVDIRLIPRDQYPCGLLYFTGSDTFNQTMRQKCLKEDFTLNEYCIRRLGITGVPGESIPVSSEEDVFEVIGIPFVPPSKRTS